jgi:hypothetical protein
MDIAPSVFSDYRNAFDEYAQKVRQAQACMAVSNPDRRTIDAALLDLEKARLNYNQQRDALAQQLSKGPAEPASATAQPSRVKVVAQLRWELAGKPEGTAEDDWYRAEEIVRSTAA